MNVNSTNAAGVSINNNVNGAVNIATGTSTGAVSIGGNSNTVAINATNWDITTAGAITSGANGQDGAFTIYSEQGGTDYTLSFAPNAAMTQSTTFTWPTAYPVNSNMALTSDTSGNLAWKGVSGMAGVSVKYKSAAQSDDAATGTWTQDNTLNFPVAANEVWVGKIMLHATTNSNGGDLYLRITAPTGASCYINFSLIDSPSSGAGPLTACGASTPYLDLVNAVTDGVEMNFTIINGGTAGTAYLEFDVDVDGAIVQLLTGSHMNIIRY